MNDMERKYKSALVALMLGRFGNRGAGAFYSAIAMRLPGRCSPEVETFATNGKEIIYNPDFIATLSEREIVGVIAHEVLHVAVLHHCRKGSRNHQRWNIACDLAINQIIIEGGLSLPAGACMAGVGPYANMPSNKTAEEYYTLLPDCEQPDQPSDKPGDDPGKPGDKPGDKGTGDQPSDKPSDKPGEQPGKPQPGKKQGGKGGFGEVLEAPNPAEAESDARAMVATATEMSKGSMSAGLRQAVDAVRASVDWRRVLQDLLTRKVKQDYVYTRPSRRAAKGVILPILGGKACPKVAVLVDTSGSINNTTLGDFMAEIRAFRDAAKCNVVLIMHNVDAYEVVEVAPDEDLVMPRPQGGGTSHVDAIQKALVAEAEVIVALTDCFSCYPNDPGVDVIWVRHCQGYSVGKPPEYGQVVDIVQ